MKKTEKKIILSSKKCQKLITGKIIDGNRASTFGSCNNTRIVDSAKS